MQGIFWAGILLLVFGVILGVAGGVIDALRGRPRRYAPVMMAFGFVLSVIGVVIICGAALIASFSGIH